MWHLHLHLNFLIFTCLMRLCRQDLAACLILHNHAMPTCLPACVPACLPALYLSLLHQATTPNFYVPPTSMLLNRTGSSEYHNSHDKRNASDSLQGSAGYYNAEVLNYERLLCSTDMLYWVYTQSPLIQLTLNCMGCHSSITQHTTHTA